MSIILQKEVTLDEALLDSLKAGECGCKFTLKTKSDGSRWLGYGCNAGYTLGNQRLIDNFLSSVPPQEKMMNILSGDHNWRRIDHLVSPETIFELLKLEPCLRCGGFLFQPMQERQKVAP